MSSRNVLVCFDAFGTLFTPRRPVVEQYAEVGRSLGLTGFSEEDLGAAFASAFKQESRQNPNFGKATGLGAVKWWNNIIVNTFQKVTGQELPSELAPKLIHRFHCEEGYILYPDVKPLLHKLRAYAKEEKSNVVLGVITNSDDRVPDILKGFDLKVNMLRHGDSVEKPLDSEHDLDFAIMSYDVGYEKPDRRIFDAAGEMLDKIISASDDSDRLPSSGSWDKIYVGDEHKKDVVGALSAGWSVGLIDRDGSQPGDGMAQLSDEDSSSLFEAFAKSRAIRFADLDGLTRRIQT